MLLGDSIRMGYWQYVKKNLKEIAEAFYPEVNCEHTQNTLVYLPAWLKLTGDPKEID